MQKTGLPLDWVSVGFRAGSLPPFLCSEFRDEKLPRLSCLSLASQRRTVSQKRVDCLSTLKLAPGLCVTRGILER